MNKRFSHIGTLLVALLLVVSPAFVFGQGIVTGTISGTVVDPQGAVVSGATVVAKDNATNREFTTTSDDSGAFALRGVPVGVYSVAIEAPNFKRVQIASVQVFSGRVTAMGARALEVGGAGEVVDVEGTAPLVEATSSQVSTSFENRKVTDLPVNNAFDSLALMAPGMASGADAGFSNTNGADLTSNGQRARSNNFQIDGQSNNDNSVGGPSFFVSNQDVIAEFQVITNNYSAEYGRNMGSVVNYVTKSGTNSFHGTAYWFHRNNVTDSLRNQERSPLFTGRNGLPFCTPDEDPAGGTCEEPQKEKDLTNRFGFTLGGPIVADKLWFFGSMEDERQRVAGSLFSSAPLVTPTPTGIAQLNAAFPGNPAVEHLTNFGPTSVALGNPVFGNPQTIVVTGPGGVSAPVEFGEISRFVPGAFANRQWTVRGDWQITDKDRFFARYLRQGFNNAGIFGTGRFAAGAFVNIPGTGQQIGLDWSRSWTSHFINQVRFSYSRAGFGFEGGGYPFCTQVNILECPAGISFSSTFAAFGQQNNLPQGRLINNTQYQDNASWVIGRHTVKFGGEYARQRSPNVFLPNIFGQFLFDDFDDFLQGNSLRLSLADGPAAFGFKEQDVAFYVQDDWRVTDNFTLNLGVRYEWFEQAINLLHDLTVARESDPATAFWDPNLPIEAKTVPAVPEDRNNWGPNVGFAWTPRLWEGLFGRDKTVIRGGYRIAYDPAFYNMFLNVATAAPTVNAANIVGVGLPAGFPATGTGLRDAGYLGFMPTGACGVLCDPRFRNQTQVAEDFRNPYTQQWSLGVQRQITPKVAGEVRYVGNHTIGNFQTINANPFIAGLATDFPELLPAGVTPCADPAAPGFGRVDCNFALIRRRANSAFSIYHGLQSRLDIQNWRGLTMGAGYTWSKAIDNVSEIFSTFGGAVTIAGSQNPFDFNVAERGVSGYSFPHVAGAYWIYELPMFRSQEGVVGHILGGWQINGTYRFQSGQALTIAQFFGNTNCDDGFNFVFYGATTCRPFIGNEGAALDTVGACTDPTLPDCGLVDFFTGLPTTADAVHWIYNDDASALFFGSPFEGTVGRNTVRGEPINNVDFGIFKNTKITERFTVQFQTNIFNLLNRQLRGVPGSTAATGVPDPFIDFGSFMSDRFGNSNRRRMIFGLKLIF